MPSPASAKDTGMARAGAVRLTNAPEGRHRGTGYPDQERAP